MAKGKKGKGGKSKAGKGKLSFSDKVSKALLDEDYGLGKTLCEIECKAFGTDKFGTMKRCKKCPEIVSVFCKEMLDGVYQEEDAPVETAKTDTVKDDGKTAQARNDQPYTKVLKELVKGTKLADIAVIIAGDVPTPKSFIGKVSCIFGAIVGKSKGRGVIYKGIKELKAGKKITKSGSSGYISKVYDAYQGLKVKYVPPVKKEAKPKKDAEAKKDSKKGNSEKGKKGKKGAGKGGAETGNKSK